MIRLIKTLIKQNNNNNNTNKIKELKAYTEILLKDPEIKAPEISQEIINKINGVIK